MKIQYACAYLQHLKVNEKPKPIMSDFYWIEPIERIGESFQAALKKWQSSCITVSYANRTERDKIFDMIRSGDANPLKINHENFKSAIEQGIIISADTIRIEEKGVFTKKYPNGSHKGIKELVSVAYISQEKMCSHNSWRRRIGSDSKMCNDCGMLLEEGNELLFIENFDVSENVIVSIGEEKKMNGIRKICKRAWRVSEFEKRIQKHHNRANEIWNEIETDMLDSGMAVGEAFYCINHWKNKYFLTRK